MFVIPGILAMLAFVYVRPHEVFVVLQAVTFPMVLAFGAFGFLLDVRVGATSLRRPWLLPVLAAAFFGWVTLTIALKAPDTLTEHLNSLAVPVGVFLAISLGVSTLRGFNTVTVWLLSITMVLAVIGIHQGASPSVCLLPDQAEAAAAAAAGDSAVGKPCTARTDCFDNSDSGREYQCEHMGLMDTTSIGGRVRYRGVFQDPNELAWALALALPFVFIWYERRKDRGSRTFDRVIVAGVLLACIACNVLTRSRSGQLALLATLGVYFVRRFGWRGVAFAGGLAAPLLLFGGREGAESSTQERLECWAEALSLWREHPLLGVGARQFGQHHYLTAHNSLLLSLAELGPIGLVLFTAVVYTAFKITLQVQRDLADRPEAAEARGAAFATLAALVGMMVSAFFLSLTYHVALWLMIGLAASVEATVARHDPDWRLRWRWRDTLAVIGLDVALVAAIAVYLRLKGV